jgi:hypothetical protein
MLAQLAGDALGAPTKHRGKNTTGWAGVGTDCYKLTEATLSVSTAHGTSFDRQEACMIRD